MNWEPFAAEAAEQCVAAREENDALRAEVRDLKARLKAVRARLPKPSNPEDLDEIERELWALTDLRRKNWRKP